jgi:PEP-CTERM motif-containing protein
MARCLLVFEEAGKDNEPAMKQSYCTDNFGGFMKLRTFSKIAALTLAASTGVANAGPLWEFDSPGNSFTNGSWDFATSFLVNSDITATGLGYYADPTSGSVDDNPVALYKCSNADCTGTGTLLASVIVDNTYALTGHFRYVTIAPILLEAGMSYQVAGVSASDNYTWNDPGFATDPAISLIALSGQVGRWEAGTAPNFLNYGQTDIVGQDGFWGPNVFVGTPDFTVPAPGVLGLVGLGLAGLGFSRRRKAS